MSLISQEKLQQALDTWVARLLAQTSEMAGHELAIVGLISHGDVLARRLVQRLEEVGYPARYGAIDITLYRDDLRLSGKRPALRSSHLPFSTDDMVLILVDDVINTGRTARAALEAIFEYGRPARVELQCLVDRGGRELPIQPDYAAFTLHAKDDSDVVVRLRELDGSDEIQY